MGKSSQIFFCDFVVLIGHNQNNKKNMKMQCETDTDKTQEKTL